MIRQSLFPLSIRGYAILFLGMVILFFAVLGWYLLDSIENTHQDIYAQKHQAARSELELAVDNLVDVFNSQSLGINQWDELFQQIANPSYYSYWREHRLLNADVLPNYVEHAEVYNAQGKALAVLASSVFPAVINPADTQPQVSWMDDQHHLTLYLPIQRSSNARDPLQGYLGIRFSFLDALKTQARFRFLEPDSLQLDPQPTAILSVEDVLTQLEYELKPNTEVNAMMGIVQTSVIQVASIVGLVCFFFYFLLVYLLGRPLIQISEYIDELRQSGPGRSLESIDSLLPIKELEKVRNSLNQYHADLEKANTDLDEKNRELWNLAHHDALTGMRNRRAFENEFAKSKQLLSNHRVDLGLALFDVNHFKAINDTYGHQVGDEVLIAISRTIDTVLRKGEHLFRLGGDEFACIIIGSSPAEIETLANRCIESVNQYDFSSLGIKEGIKVACGISHCHADDTERLVNLQWQADVAVYRAKRPGISHPVLFSDEMSDGSEAIFSSWINNAIYQAITDGKGIEMHYQPVVENATGNRAFNEALLRIRHNDELIPPNSIFPVVSLRNLQSDMDRAVIKAVADDIQNQLVPAGNTISINLSAETITHTEMVHWLDPLTAVIDPKLIILEVTETSLITQLNTAVSNLNRLRELGYRIALDDFGSGYSSLRYLTNMPVDIIKFDISLIQEISSARQEKLVYELAYMLVDLGYE
ncbi:MAG: EAL domain-containing protein, partial [bacterium]